PEMQRRGIGRALMSHLLAWADARGCPTIVLDATPEGAPLYEQFGFIDDGLTSQWNRYPSSLPAPLYPQSSLHIEALRPGDLPELTSFDARSSSVQRARMLDLFLTSYAGRAFIARDNECHIQGYLFVQEHTLGPWIAASEQAAELLLRHALEHTIHADACNVLSPIANSSAEALFEHYGFQHYRALRYMRRGQPLKQELTTIYAIASYAIG
ncbi:MAG: GNAT family N-acetyltransferase, partial [Ktedonobacteraceae bacterium]|nr:GNAT family N-acetyltransferase [Ktedonobacteraceae bacterium]